VKNSQINIGDRIVYTKTHEGHECVIKGIIEPKEGPIKYSVLCECGSELYLLRDNFQVK
jgi:hypothetical protein